MQSVNISKIAVKSEWLIFVWTNDDFCEHIWNWLQETRDMQQLEV